MGVVALVPQQYQSCEEEVGEKDCSGCGRSTLSFCWARPCERLTWGLPNFRGAWRRDGFNLWRLWFQPQTTLVMLAVHIGDGTTDFAEVWYIALLSWVSLRRQGVDRITSSMLSERIELVKFILKALGFPMRNFLVVPLME